MKAFAFSFKFHSIENSVPREFLGKVKSAKNFLNRFLKIFHSYNLDLALFPSGKKPHKPRHKCKGKSSVSWPALSLPHPLGK